jgi:trimeric autotransporter adhesin
MATITGTSGNNILLGSPGTDIIRGLAGNDTLFGFGGNDFIDGGTGNDVMRGGAGNDIYVVDRPGDVVIEAPGQGIDLIRSSVHFTLSGNIENLTLTGGAPISGTGNSLNNVIAGNNVANILRGLGGADTFQGNGGNDRLDGGPGADRMFGGAGDDIYFADTAGDRVIEGARSGIDTVVSRVSFVLGPNVENLTLTGSLPAHGTGNGLANVINGNGATGNVLRGLGGDDILFGDEGKDSLYGGTGNDTYIATCTCDTFIENAGEGTDLVRSSVTFDLGLTPHIENLTLTGAAAINGFGDGAGNVITGNGANNTVFGLDGNDTLLGNGGNDVLDGGGGNDTLVGGLGVDTIDGGVGADIYRYTDVAESRPSAVLVLADQLQFSQLDGDRIDVSAIDANVTIAGNNAFAFVGTAAFTAAGQLRYDVTSTGGGSSVLKIEASVDADSDAEFQVDIRVFGAIPPTLTVADFML